MALDFEQARDRMIAEQLEARGFRDAAVLAAMRQVPRHLFVEPALSVSRIITPADSEFEPP